MLLALVSVQMRNYLRRPRNLKRNGWHRLLRQASFRQLSTATLKHCSDSRRVLLQCRARSIATELIYSILGAAHDVLNSLVDVANVLRDRSFRARRARSWIAHCIHQGLNRSDKKGSRVLKVILESCQSHVHIEQRPVAPKP